MKYCYFCGQPISKSQNAYKIYPHGEECRWVHRVNCLDDYKTHVREWAKFAGAAYRMLTDKIFTKEAWYDMDKVERTAVLGEYLGKP